MNLAGRLDSPVHMEKAMIERRRSILGLDSRLGVAKLGCDSAAGEDASLDHWSGQGSRTSRVRSVATLS